MLCQWIIYSSRYSANTLQPPTIDRFLFLGEHHLDSHDDDDYDDGDDDDDDDDDLQRRRHHQTQASQ